MDRIIRFLDAAHRIWGALALIVFALLAYDAYGYFTHQPGSATRSLLVKGWQYVGETAGILDHVDGSGVTSRSASAGFGSTATPPPPERPLTSGRLTHPSDASPRIAATGGVQTDATSAADVSFGLWSCPSRPRSTDRPRPVAQFPSLSKLTDTRLRRSALRELEARLRCDYELERTQGNTDAAATASFEEWRQVALQRRYGPEWSRIDLSDLPTP